MQRGSLTVQHQLIVHRPCLIQTDPSIGRYRRDLGWRSTNILLSVTACPGGLSEIKGRRKLGQPFVGGKAETIFTALCFQHFEHRLGTIMPVAAHEDFDLPPMLADAGDDTGQNIRGLLAWAGDRPGRKGIIWVMVSVRSCWLLNGSVLQRNHKASQQLNRHSPLKFSQPHQ